MSCHLERGVLAAVVLLLASGAQAAERRCGWYQNPTPANHWLIDREGMWIIAEQGGYQAPGLDEMPDMHVREWVRVNGHYGYGCACLSVDVDRRLMRVTRILAVEPLPLARCRADTALPRL